MLIVLLLTSAHRKIALGDGKSDITWEGDTISQQMLSYNFVLLRQLLCYNCSLFYCIASYGSSQLQFFSSNSKLLVRHLLACRTFSYAHAMVIMKYNNPYTINSQLY